MAAIARIIQNGGPVSWTIRVSNLKLGVYRALLFDAGNVVLEKWERQRTDDDLPDEFTVSSAPPLLLGATLWWECIISDPSDQGGSYRCTVSVIQSGNTLCQDVISGDIPAGNGKLDIVGDQISFG